MAFEMTFSTVNAAFDGDMAPECARILRDVAARIERGNYAGHVYDSNGNRVGQWSLELPDCDDES